MTLTLTYILTMHSNTHWSMQVITHFKLHAYIWIVSSEGLHSLLYK